MAVRDEIRQQREKLKGQGFKAHWDYFWEYYKIHTIVAVIALIFVVTLIRDMTNNKPYALFAMFVNSQGMETQDFLQDGFAEYAGIDRSAETVLVDTASNVITSSIDTTAVATSEKIMALISASELDVFVSDVSVAYHYGSQQTFTDLREIYDEKELAELSDRLFYVDGAYMDYLASEEYSDYITTGKFDASNRFAVMADEYNQTYTYTRIDPSTMDDPIPVGIMLDDSAAISQCGAYPQGGAVAAIVINSERTDRAKEFINYLMQ
jgi:hypothetical protein